MQSRIQLFLLRIVLIAPLLMLSSPAVFAWGAKGHLIVGYVADARICESTREGIGYDLNNESLAVAGLWADRIRSDRYFDYAKPWHYINVPDGVAIEDAERSAKGDILTAIDRQREELEYDSNLMKARREALRFLIHFIGDLHQPLHAGRREDLGGNKVRVASGQSLSTSNLHRYWDVDVLVEVKDPQAYAADLLARAEPELADWRPLEPNDWARESAELRGLVYDFPQPQTGVGQGRAVLLDESYYVKAREIADQRLTLAGLRLAAELDSLYCSSKERRARKQAR